MKVLVGKDTDEWLKRCEEWCQEHLSQSHTNRLFIPAGNTPVLLYQHWERTRPQYLNHCKLYQVDEVLENNQAGRFQKFFESQLPSYQNQMVWVKSDAPPATLAILGLGLNGHVAFHEPGLPAAFKKGEVTLSSSTCRELQIPVGSKGLTYGLGTFLECDAILLIVRGAKKREVLHQLIELKSRVGGDCVDFPAGCLLNHPSLTVVLDQDANPDYRGTQSGSKRPP